MSRNYGDNFRVLPKFETTLHNSALPGEVTTMPFFESHSDDRIYFRDWGTGTPVVLIHGWPLNSDMWEGQAEFLVQNGNRVITYDRRGFGRSDQPWSGYDYDTFADDLQLLLENLHLQDVVLVGFSMGGGEVARYLARFGSQRVAKAVFISSVTPYLAKAQDNPEGIEPQEFAKIEAAVREDRPKFLEEFAQKFYGRSTLHHTVSAAMLQWTQAMAFTSSLHPTIAAAGAWAMTDFRNDLQKIDIPVLLIHGTNDATVPIDNSARRAIKMIRDATLIEFEGEPHGLFITASDRLNAELQRFISGRGEVDIPETTVTRDAVRVVKAG